MSHSSFPTCTHSGSGSPCECCQRWIQWTEKERQQQHHSSTWSDAHYHDGLLQPALDLSLDCCSLEQTFETTGNGTGAGGILRSSRRVSVEVDMSNVPPGVEDDGCGMVGMNMSTSPFMEPCSSTTPSQTLSLCVDHACVLPTLNLSQQFMNDGGNGSMSGGLNLGNTFPSGGSIIPQTSPDEQMHFHSLLPADAAHVHCTEESILATQDEQQRLAHIHTKACNPQVHYQFSTNNVLHDHTVPLLATSPVKIELDQHTSWAGSSAAAISGDERKDGSAGTDGSGDTTMKTESNPAAPSSRPQVHVPIVTSTPLLPCSRVHTFPPVLRFHPYGTAPVLSRQQLSAVTAEGPTGSAGSGGTSPANANAPASNCHQCKVKKYSATVIQCTAVHEVTVRRSKPMCCIQKKKCAKKYCATCLAKHYGLTLDQLDRATWVCPGCLGHCNCAACTAKTTAANGGRPSSASGSGISPSNPSSAASSSAGFGLNTATTATGSMIHPSSLSVDALSEVQTTHTHHTHVPTHSIGGLTTKTTYGYATAPPGLMSHSHSHVHAHSHGHPHVHGLPSYAPANAAPTISLQQQQQQQQQSHPPMNAQIHTVTHDLPAERIQQMSLQETHHTMR